MDYNEHYARETAMGHAVAIAIEIIKTNGTINTLEIVQTAEALFSFTGHVPDNNHKSDIVSSAAYDLTDVQPF